jgi:RimJ/RimL family protein N-acetyltransferase
VQDQVRQNLEGEWGFSLESVLPGRISVRESPNRTDEPWNRLVIQHLAERDAVVVSGTPSIIAAIRPTVLSMTSWELLSPLGIAELRRLLRPMGVESFSHGHDCPLFEYALTNQDGFRPIHAPHAVTPLRKKDIPPGQLDLRMSERRPSEAEEFTWAFACYQSDREGRAVELVDFGPGCASVAILIWNWKRGCPDSAGYGVYTEEFCRGRGYATAVVSAATRWILEQGGVAWYEAHATNVASLMIARRLGFKPICQTIRA